MPILSKDEASREEILQAAKRTFQKWGLSKTTMEDIAREAGKGKSTLYYYYQSKEEIFDKVVQVEIGALLAKARASVSEVRSPREKLRTYIAESITGFKESVALHDIVRIEIKEDPRFFLKMMKHFEPGEVKFLQEMLTLGVQQNQFNFANDQELEAVAHVVLETVHALELYLFLDEYDSRYAPRVARLIANGV